MTRGVAAVQESLHRQDVCLFYSLKVFLMKPCTTMPAAPKTLGTTAGKLTKQQSDLDMSTLEMINKVFSNIEDIVPLHQKFLTMLQGISKDWSELSKVGYAFIQMVHKKYARLFIDKCASMIDKRA